MTADLFGDWREELILRTEDNSKLRIWCTNTETKYRMDTLMHDMQYRMQCGCQQSSYNQPPHPSFYLGTEAPLPARPNVKLNNTPPEPISGTYIKNLNVLDRDNMLSWQLSKSSDTGSLIYGDRDFTYTELPECLKGKEAIMTACNSKNTFADLAEFTASENIDVFVLLDTRVEAAGSTPAWLSGWTKTDMTAASSNEVRFSVYKKTFVGGEKVTLGQNGMNGNCMNYTVFADAVAVETTTTTTETTTTTTETTTTTTETTTVSTNGTVNESKINFITVAQTKTQTIYANTKTEIELVSFGDKDEEIVDIDFDVSCGANSVKLSDNAVKSRNGEIDGKTMPLFIPTINVEASEAGTYTIYMRVNRVYNSDGQNIDFRLGSNDEFTITLVVNEPDTSTASDVTGTATTTTTTAPTVSLIGDANVDGKVSVADAVAILQAVANKDKYSLKPQGAINADCYDPGDGVTANDALAIQKLDAGSIDKLPEYSKK